MAEAPDDTPLLEVRNLHTQLRARDGRQVVRAVDGVGFTLRRGRTLGIVGESGCGKSMTAYSIMGLLPGTGRVTQGEVRLDGQDLLRLGAREMARVRGRRIAMIFQDPMTALDPLFTIGSQLAEPLRAHEGLRGGALQARMVELLTLVGIPSPAQRLQQYPHAFSGGMLQRVVGAIAMACNPDLLIADEPTTALDPTVQAQYLDLLEELRARRGLAIILVTHDFGVAARLCDEILVMYAGRAVEQGPVETIFDAPRHPYTRALLRLAQTGHDHHPGPLPTIEGQPPDLTRPLPGCPYAPRCPEADARCREQAPPRVAVDTSHHAVCWMADRATPHAVESRS